MPSSIQSSLQQQPPLPGASSFDLTQTQHSPPNDTGRVVFTRQLWQRNMPGRAQSEKSVLNKSQTVNSQASHNNASESSRKNSSAVASSRSRRRSPSPSGDSKTPLTPEESPPFRTTRKRSAGVAEREDRTIDSADTSPSHTGNSSGDLAVHVCICQRDPKIPRPRNAFILYRQHHQANVVARHPGLANPEISKIIGEQWQNETPDQKNKWKALAEEEKIRHQQQYPTYRYQPKRTSRRNSTDGPDSAGDKPKCQKCAGRVILVPSAAGSTTHSNATTPANSTVVTPLSRALPVLRDLSLESPASRQLRTSYAKAMSNNTHVHAEDRDDVGPLSPESKRRRFNNTDPPPTVARVMPPRYAGPPPGVAVGPGTPFPFAQPPHPHAYPPTTTTIRRESLPGIRGVVSPPGAGPPPGPMAPPPRPGMGYAQHRFSQGHIHPDRSLTLPPLQPSSNHLASDISVPPTTAKSADEQIMNISFRYKIKVLCQVAPPAPKTRDAPRGPLIAVEGDTPEAVANMAAWLRNRLGGEGEGLDVRLIEGPRVGEDGAGVGGKEEAMARYHRLAAEWLGRSGEILGGLGVVKAREEDGGDAVMRDASAASGSTTPQPSAGRKLDEDYNDSSDEASSSQPADHTTAKEGDKLDTNAAASRANSTTSDTTPAEKMDVDKRSSIASSSALPTTTTTTTTTKPVTIIPNYSLHTSNLFARLIPIGPNDPYAPNDHWQWTATLWRGIIGPDLWIYVRDAPTANNTPAGSAAGAGPGGDGMAAVASGPSVEIEGVEGRGEVGLFVVKRVSGAGGQGEGEGGMVEASVLRRVGFEVGEWVRAFAGVGV